MEPLGIEQIVKLGRRNIGDRYERTKYDIREKSFADLWHEENKKKRYINFGQGLLQDLFIKTKDDMMQSKFVEVIITPRERFIVATVIQWLGTNCGWCFLSEVLDKAGYKIVKK